LYAAGAVEPFWWVDAAAAKKELVRFQLYNAKTSRLVRKVLRHNESCKVRVGRGNSSAHRELYQMKRKIASQGGEAIERVVAARKMVSEKQEMSSPG